MKKTSIIISILFSLQGYILPQVNVDWINRYGSPSIDSPNDMTVDVNGNIYVTGFFSTTSQGTDIATIKYTRAGVLKWIRFFNGTGNGNDQGNAIFVDYKGNVYVAGYSKYGFFNYALTIIKYDSTGTQKWVRIWDGQEGVAKDIEVDVNGNVFVTGYLFGPIYFTETMKCDSNGVVQWEKTYNATYDSQGLALTLDGLGNVYMTGYTSNSFDSTGDYLTVKYNFTGGQQWAAVYNGPANGNDYAVSIALDFGNVCVTGSSPGTGTAYDYATIKYSSTGVQQWVARYNGPAGSGPDYAHKVAVDFFGVYVTGESTDSNYFYDYATVKYNSSGVQQWSKRFNGGFGDDYAYSLVLDGFYGDVYVTGKSRGNGTDFNYTTVKYNTNGIEQWEIGYNGTGNGADYGYSIVLDNYNNVIVTGASTGIGSGLDVVTVKYSQPNAIRPISSEIPEKYSLSQNYPNPFNPSTKIRFDIPKSSFVLLKIYNELGQEIVNLVNEQVNAGTYEADWDASKYPSGVYFYRMTSGDYTNIKKMILVK